MNSISECIGKRIRLYRKIKKLTIDELSAMINKSKATLSKYENGSISIDIQTLLDISNALRIDIHQLIDYNQEKNSDHCDQSKLFGGISKLYIYLYDGRKNKIVKSLLKLNKNDVQGIIETNLYFNIPSYDFYDGCKFFYSGHLISYDIITYLFLENQANNMEKLCIYILNPLGNSATTVGLLSGISHNPLAPVIFKVLISQSIISDNDMPMDMLYFSKEDLKIMKLYNALILKS